MDVIDCDVNTLERSIALALSDDFKNKCQDVENIYGNGNASEIIVNALERSRLSVVKKFVDKDNRE